MHFNSILCNRYRKSVRTISGLIIGLMLCAGITSFFSPNTAHAAAISDDLISHWTLDEESGTRVDSHGDNDLTPSGTGPYGEGKMSNGFAPTGSGTEGRIEVADNASLSMTDADDFTISAWVNFDTLSGTRGIIGKSNTEYLLYSSGSILRFAVYGGSSGTASTVSSANVPAGNWHFVVAWYDADAHTVNIQVNNGTPVSAAATAGRPVDGANAFVIGAITTTGYSDGIIDSVSIWQRLLTSDERSALYNSGDGLEYPFVIIPDSPTNLEATGGNTVVNLTWTAPESDGGSAVTDYVIEYKLSSEPTTWSTFSDGASSETETTVTGLTNGLSYDFRVSAVNAAGTSSPSATDSAVPPVSEPEAPVANSVAISGNANVSEMLTGSYTYSDANGDDEGASTYRWMRSDTAGGTYTAISGATSTTYTLTEDDLGKYIKFEVTPVTDVSPTTGGAALSSATSQVKNERILYHIVSTGQSLSLGSQGSPALTTEQPYENVQLSGTSLVPLVESSVETMSSALANTLTNLSPLEDTMSAVTVGGLGGSAYSVIKKGTATYNGNLTKATNVKNAAAELGIPEKIAGVTVIHGETDMLNDVSAETYESYLVEWQSDYNTDLKAITGQEEDIPLFTDQTSSQSGYSKITAGVPIGQLAASENHPGDIILIGPKYFLTYDDNVHLVNTSYRWLGEYYGKVFKKVLIDGESWRPLSPDQATRVGNEVYVDFHVPEGELVFDTTLVIERTNYGFEYYDDASSATISSVEIHDEDTVKVTLSTTPTGGNQRIRYAYTTNTFTWPGAQKVNSAGGNLRDTDSTESLYGNTLYNWAVHFDKPITSDSTAPVISSVAANSSTTSAAITWTTGESASSIVEYGLTSDYGSSTSETDTSPRVTSHTVNVSGLVACTTYHFRVKSEDDNDNLATGSDNSFTTAGCTGSAQVEEDVAEEIDSNTGGSVELDEGGMTLAVPADATDADATYQIKLLGGEAVIDALGSPSGYHASFGRIYDIKAFSNSTTTIDSFDQPIEIIVSYSDEDIEGLNESSLTLYRYHDGAWQALDDCVVDANANSITCTTDHFSVFGLFGVVDSSGSSRSIVSGGVVYCTAERTTFCRPRVQQPAPIDVQLGLPVRNLKLGMVGEDVRALQRILNASGFQVSATGPGSVGSETNFFGSLTRAAVARYQLMRGISPSVGYFGPITRAHMKSAGLPGLWW